MTKVRSNFFCLVFNQHIEHNQFQSVSDEAIDYLALQLISNFMKSKNMTQSKEEQVHMMQMQLRFKQFDCIVERLMTKPTLFLLVDSKPKVAKFIKLLI